MASPRRKGTPSSAVRSRLVSVAREILFAEGLPALSAKRVAETIGLKRQIVHYYFHSMEDLLLEIIRRQAEVLTQNVRAAVKAEDSLAILAELSVQYAENALHLEILGYALRHKPVAAQLCRDFDAVRGVLEAALTRQFARAGLTPSVPPAAVLIIVVAVGQALSVEADLGMTHGHAAARQALDELVRGYLATGRLAAIEPANHANDLQ